MKSFYRKKLLSAYEKIYDSKEGVGKLNLCKECQGAPCEKGPDIVVLLPFEAEFIRNKLREKKLKHAAQDINNIETETGACPFFQKDKCAIHCSRPIDCRTYPLMPIFRENTFEIRLLRGCPYGNDVPESFLKATSRVWQKLSPLLSLHWKRKYNKIVSGLPLRELPIHLSFK